MVYPSIDLDHFKLMYGRSSLKDFLPEIYQFLLEFHTPANAFDVQHIPVEYFDDRIEYCHALAQMLLSLTVNGIQVKGYNTIRPRFVEPLVSSIKNLLADSIASIENEMDEMSGEVDALEDGTSENTPAYENYLDTHITTEYEKMLEDIVIDSFGTYTHLPTSKSVRKLPVPIPLATIEKIVNKIELAMEQRAALKQRVRGNLNMNMFVCSVFTIGVPPTREVFRDLYDCLNDFGLIDKEQVKRHEDKNLKHNPKEAKADYVSSYYKQLKKKGLISSPR